MGEEARFDHELRDGLSVARVAGDIDITNVKRLAELLDLALDTPAPAVVISLEDVTYFDSYTIHVVIECAKVLDAQGRRLLVIRPSAKSTSRIFNLLHLDMAISTFDSFAEVSQGLGVASAQLTLSKG